LRKSQLIIVCDVSWSFSVSQYFCTFHLGRHSGRKTRSTTENYVFRVVAATRPSIFDNSV